MCDTHYVDERFWLRRLIMQAYGKWIQDTLGFYLFLGRLGRLPVLGPVVRFCAGLYGRYLHGGRVITTKECLETIKHARQIAVVDCACREKYNRCGSPRKTCLVINTGAEIFTGLKDGEFIPPGKAAEIIDDCNRHGLIHSITHCMAPNVYAICNCCTCCCVPYTLRTVYGIKHALAEGGRVAVIDPAKCGICNKCKEVCPEKAIRPDHGIVETSRCIGCGLCLDRCPRDAIQMSERKEIHQPAVPGPVEKVLMYTAFICVILPMAVLFKLFHAQNCKQK